MVRIRVTFMSIPTSFFKSGGTLRKHAGDITAFVDTHLTRPWPKGSIGSSALTPSY